MSFSPLPSTELDPLRTAGTMIRLVRVLEHRLALCGREDGLTLAELSVMLEIEHGTELPSAIARARHLDPARVSRIVDRLVLLGFVARHMSERDRRRLPLTLTAKGQERLHQGLEDVRSAMRSLLDGLTDGERVALGQAVEGVQRVLSAEQS